MSIIKVQKAVLVAKDSQDQPWSVRLSCYLAALSITLRWYSDNPAQTQIFVSLRTWMETWISWKKPNRDKQSLVHQLICLLCLSSDSLKGSSYFNPAFLWMLWNIPFKYKSFCFKVTNFNSHVITDKVSQSVSVDTSCPESEHISVAATLLQITQKEEEEARHLS